MFEALTKERKRAHAEKAAIQWSMILDDLSDIFNSLTDERWRDAFMPLVKGVVEDAATHWTAETGISFSTRNLEAEDWFSDNTLKFVTPINQTSERELAALLQQADREGWTITQTQKALTDTFNQWMHGTTDAATFAGERLPPYRTEMIARTTSTASFGGGSLALFKSESVEQKEWLTQIDGREREAHAEANGQVVNTEDPFIVDGEELDYPGDPSGSPGNVISCRCTILPVLSEGSSSAEDVNAENA